MALALKSEGMTKAGRPSPLKARFKAIGGVPFLGRSIRPRQPAPGAKKRVHIPWPESEPAVNPRRLPALYKAVEKPFVRLMPKGRSGVSPLAQIAEQLPGKLPRGFLSP